ncbi:MAG: hypothetical protein Q8P59_13810 [Dehalococcoidia bacterium]|nr:hypothetical protein [Dehalococcoidia bacterium]
MLRSLPFVAGILHLVAQHEYLGLFVFLLVEESGIRLWRTRRE